MQSLKALFIYCAGTLCAAPVLLGGIEIHFDYRFDGSGFFSGANLERREILEAAAMVFEDRITSHFGAIIPQGPNRWSLNFPNPSTGEPVTINNPTLLADAITVYVGARDLESLGVAEVSVSYSGFQSWVDLIASRNSASRFEPWGGAIAFDSGASWYFDDDVSTLESFSGKFDFYSVAVHELAHLLGFGLGSRAFAANVVGTSYAGSHAVALYGGPIPLAGPEDLQHWRQGFQFEGQLAAMSTSTNPNKRTYFTELEFAILRDIGYSISEPVLLTQPPFFVGLIDRVVMDEDSVETIAFQIGDPDTLVEGLSIEVSSKNTELIDNTGLALSGDGTVRQLRLAPKQDAFGEANIEVRLSDGDFTVSHLIELIVVAVNDPPVLGAVFDISVEEDASLQPVEISVSDMDNEISELQFEVSSSNTDLIADAAVTISEDRERVILQLSLVENAFGSATITLIADDGDSRVERSFSILVDPVDDPPVISEIPEVTMEMDQEHRLTFTVVDPESGPEEILFSFTSRNQQLLASDDLEVTGNGEEKTLIVRPKMGQTGEATISLFANDPARNFAFRQFKVIVEKIVPEIISLSIRRTLGGLEILWSGEGVLQHADFVDGSFSDVPDATSPYAIDPQADRFYRVLKK